MLRAIIQPAAHDDVRLTFDDGNASDVVHALPALRDRGLTATFFVVAARVGEPGFLDADDIGRLRDAGMTIGSHGMRHRPWRRLGASELHEELVDARRMLEDIVGTRVTEAACPFGSYDRAALRTLRGAGYRRVYTSDRGSARHDDWIQARNTVGADDDASLVTRLLAAERPAPRRLRTLKQVAKRWR